MSTPAEIVRPETGEIVPAPQMILPAGSIDEAVEAFSRYQELKERLGTKEDFQPIKGKKHPKKSFVRKVQRYFNVSCEILRDEPLKSKDGDDLLAWLVTARAIHLPTGAYQDADGSCSPAEKAPGQDTLHNVRAHAVTRAKNRAILDLVGFGEVSAEEIITEKRGKRPSSKAPEGDDPIWPWKGAGYRKPLSEVPEEELKKALGANISDPWREAIYSEMEERKFAQEAEGDD